MRVLHAMFSPGVGGIETAFMRYSDAFSLLGYEQLNLMDENSPLLGQMELTPVKPIRQAGQYDVRAILNIHRIIKEFKPHILVTHGNRASRLMQRANWRHEIPEVAVLHRYRFKGLKKLDGVFCVSRGIQEAAREFGLRHETTRYMPNIVTPPAEVTPPKPHFSSPPVIGFLGRFVPEKGADILLESLKILYDDGMPFQAVFAGDGPERSTLKRLATEYGIRDQVKFVGWVDDIYKFFKAIDMLVVPSRSESFGLIILESWLHNRPIIATKTAGPSELITHEKDGLLCPIEPKAIAEQIRHLHHVNGLAHDVCRHGNDMVENFFLENMAERLDLLLNDVIERTKSTS